MSRLVFDGKYAVLFLDTAPADPAAPTVAELTAGTDITKLIPKDGFKPGVTNNRVSGGSLDETFMDESMGTWSSQLSIDFYLDDVTGDNIGLDTFAQFATGAIVAIWDGHGNAAGSKAYVWPDIECGQPIPADSAENARQKGTAEIAVRQAPDFHAVVAA